MDQRLKEAREFLDEVEVLLHAKQEDEWGMACERLEQLPDVSNKDELKRLMTCLAKGEHFQATKAIFIPDGAIIKTKGSTVTKELALSAETLDREDSDKYYSEGSLIEDVMAGYDTDETECLDDIKLIRSKGLSANEVHEAIQALEREAMARYKKPIHRVLFPWKGQKLWYDPKRHPELHKAHFDFWMRRRVTFYEEMFDDPLRFGPSETTAKATRRKARYCAIQDRTRFLNRCLEIWGPDRLDRLIKDSDSSLFWWGGYIDRSKKKKDTRRNIPEPVRMLKPLTAYLKEELDHRMNLKRLMSHRKRDEVLDQNIWELLFRSEAVSPITKYQEGRRFSDFALTRVSMDMIDAVTRGDVRNEGYIRELDQCRDFDEEEKRIRSQLSRKRLTLPPFANKLSAPKIREDHSDIDTAEYVPFTWSPIPKTREEEPITPLSTAAIKKKLGTAQKEATALAKKRMIKELDYDEGVDLMKKHKERVDEAKRPKRSSQDKRHSLGTAKAIEDDHSIVVSDGPNIMTRESGERGEGEIDQEDEAIHQREAAQALSELGQDDVEYQNL